MCDIILAAVWREYHSKDKSRNRETFFKMMAVMSTVKRTRVIAVELGKVNAFLTYSGDRLEGGG